MVDIYIDNSLLTYMIKQSMTKKKLDITLVKHPERIKKKWKTFTSSFDSNTMIRSGIMCLSLYHLNMNQNHVLELKKSENQTLL